MGPEYYLVICLLEDLYLKYSLVIQSNQIYVPTVFSINTLYKSNNNKIQIIVQMLLPSQYKNVAIKRRKWQDYDDDNKDSGTHTYSCYGLYFVRNKYYVLPVQYNRGGTYF